MILWLATAAIITLTTPLTAQSLLTSPCPNEFQYNEQLKGQWTGTLHLKSDVDLHGLWIRVFFDQGVPTEIIPSAGLQVVKNENNQFLIKDRDAILKARTATNVTLTVKFDGGDEKVPRLTGYRLNAHVVCPPDSGYKSSDIYHGSKANEYFYPSILPPQQNAVAKPDFACGLLPKTKEALTYPWSAQIITHIVDEKLHTCDATLISNRHLLVPAHCVTFNQSNVAIAAKLLSVQFASSTANQYAVAEIIVYPGYQSLNLLNDVAILRLSKEVNVNEQLRPACIPDDVFDPEVVPNPKLRLVAGDGVVTADVEITNDCKLPTSLQTDQTYCAIYREGKCVGVSGSGVNWIDDAGTVYLDGMVTLDMVLQNKKDCSPSSGSLLVLDVNKYAKWIWAQIGKSNDY